MEHLEKIILILNYYVYKGKEVDMAEIKYKIEMVITIDNKLIKK